MSAKFDLIAEKREEKGTSASRRLRHAGKIPAVIYGGDKGSEMVAFNHDKIYHLLEQEAFHTSVLTIKHGKDSEQAILRDLQMHPFRQQVVHMDLQRISATEKLHMQVPLHYVGEDQAPGVKLQDGLFSHLMTDLDVTCLPKDLPEFLPVDVSEMNLGDTLHLSDLVVPDGVEVTSLTHGGNDLAMVTITALKVVVEEEVAPVAEGEEGEAGEEGETAPSEAEEEKKEGE